MFAYPCVLETVCLLTPVFWRQCACLPLCFGDSVLAYPCVLETVCLLTPVFWRQCACLPLCFGDSVLAYPFVFRRQCACLPLCFVVRLSPFAVQFYQVFIKPVCSCTDLIHCVCQFISIVTTIREITRCNIYPKIDITVQYKSWFVLCTSAKNHP